MAERYLSSAALESHHGLDGLRLASPRRRLAAMAIDVVLLFVPSVVVTILAAGLALALLDPAAFRAIKSLVDGAERDERARVEQLADIASLLVRVEADGLPPELTIAVREGNRARAAALLTERDIAFGSSPGARNALGDKEIFVDFQSLIPFGFRSVSTFGVAALYFVFFLTGRRRATPGKRVLRLEVLKLSGEPLSAWDAFERFGGYLASIGTLGFGLLDFWRDPNRRLAHDRIASTVVVKRAKRV